MTLFHQAQILLREFKGDEYLHGLDVLPQVGRVAARCGQRAALVRGGFLGADALAETVSRSLRDAGVTLTSQIAGPAPNAPLEDLARMTAQLAATDADLVISLGGGSLIDATKAAIVMRSLGGDIEEYFGTGLVTQAMAAGGQILLPHVAIQTAASSGAHLTKYANVTNLQTGQKKLIVDEAIVPIQPVFDYRVTLSAPPSLTADGALDGVSHALEVLYGAVGKPYYEQAARVAGACIGLVVAFLPRVLQNPGNVEGREALGLATDLGAYAIMLGGTNGAHLTSFSLVDILSHGRACALMNPYYTIFFAPAIEAPLRLVGNILQQAGYLSGDLERLCGRELGLAVAEAMIAFEKHIGLPTTLNDIVGFTPAHIERALAAAKNPQLRMKLENMPVPLSADRVDEYMGPVLRAAQTGDLGLVVNVPEDVIK